MSELRIQRNPDAKKRKSRVFPVLIACAVIAMLALCAFSLPVFNLSDVKVEGNSHVPAENVLGALGLNGEPKNYFLFSEMQARETLLENPYIKSAVISKKLPGSITISITERVGRCYIEYKNMNIFPLIDEDGMVLDVHDYMSENLPVIVGLKFDSFILGKYLETEDSDNFNNVVLISKIFDKYELDGVFKLDVTNRDDIHIFIGGLDIRFGGIENGDEKIRILKGILEKFPSDSRGFLDISDLGSSPVFSPLK